MRRLSMLMLILFLGACASARPAPVSDGALLAAYPSIAVQDGGGGTGTGTSTETPPEPVVRPGKSEGGARAVQWLWKGPLNLVWWPWKIVGKGVRGIVDGVSAGFGEGRVPIIGLIVSPVNAVVGLGTGLVEGIGMGPGLITPDTDAGRAFAKPTSVPTSIWWY